MNTPHHMTQKNGFTLIESIIVISISTLAMLAIASSVLFFYRTNANAIEQALALSSARKGVEYMVRDVREATYSEEGSYPIISMSDTELYFYSDTDRDNAVERIHYYLNGTVLMRETVNPTGTPLTYVDGTGELTVVSEDVRNGEDDVPMLEYFDATGTEILDYTRVSDVAIVGVTVIVNINPTRLPEEFTLRSTASLRNVRSN